MNSNPAGQTNPVALIELGTNSSKLLIADVLASGKAVMPRKFQKETTRIGEGLAEYGEITASAVIRTVNAIGRFLKLVQQYNCEHVIGYSTYAFRAASNGPETAKRIEDETGLGIKIISGEQEARFAWLSAKAGLKLSSPNTYIIDVGGGSTEFVHASRSGVLDSRSLPIGALQLTEKYLLSDPVRPDETARLRAYVSGRVNAVFEDKARSGLRPSQIDMVASGGAITTIKKMSDQSWDFTSVTSPKIRIGSVRRLEAQCLGLPLDKRKRLSGLEPDRADIIPAGLAVVLAFMEAAGKKVLTVNPYGVRLGVLLHLARNNYLW
jgi:exopolyphosphatase/guanosine-5'-triphosphate,3'-diphosphate pyrophosphatase